MIEQAQISKQRKDFVSDNHASPEAAAYWLERGDGLGRWLLAMSETIWRLWRKRLPEMPRRPDAHLP